MLTLKLLWLDPPDIPVSHSLEKTKQFAFIWKKKKATSKGGSFAFSRVITKCPGTPLVWDVWLTTSKAACFFLSVSMVFVLCFVMFQLTLSALKGVTFFGKSSPCAKCSIHLSKLHLTTLKGSEDQKAWRQPEQQGQRVPCGTGTISTTPIIFPWLNKEWFTPRIQSLTSWTSWIFHYKSH